MQNFDRIFPSDTLLDIIKHSLRSFEENDEIHNINDLVILYPGYHCQRPMEAEWRAVKDNPAIKAVKGFGAHLYISKDPQAVIKEWATPPDYIPNLHPVDEVKIGEMFAVFIIFAGCTPDVNSNCDVEADYLVYTPSGKLYSDQKRRV